jgi:hypothetical protein
MLPFDRAARMDVVFSLRWDAFDPGDIMRET